MYEFKEKDTRTGEVFNKYVWTEIDHVVTAKRIQNQEELHGFIPSAEVGLVTPYALRAPLKNYAVGMTVPLDDLKESLYPWTLRYLTLPAASGSTTGWWRFSEYTPTAVKSATCLRTLFAALKSSGLLIGFLEKETSFLNCVFNHPRNTHWRAAIISEKRKDGKYAAHPGSAGIIVGMERMEVMGDFALTPDVWIPCAVREEKKEAREGNNKVSVSTAEAFDPVQHTKKILEVLQECKSTREYVKRRQDDLSRLRGASDALAAIREAYEEYLKGNAAPVVPLDKLAREVATGQRGPLPPHKKLTFKSQNPSVVAKEVCQRLKKTEDLVASKASVEQLRALEATMGAKTRELKNLLLLKNGAINAWVESQCTRSTIATEEGDAVAAMYEAWTEACLFLVDADLHDPEVDEHLKDGIAAYSRKPSEESQAPAAPKATQGRTLVAAMRTFSAKNSSFAKRFPSMYTNLVALNAYREAHRVLSIHQETIRLLVDAKADAATIENEIARICPVAKKALETLKGELRGGLGALKGLGTDEFEKLFAKYSDAAKWTKGGLDLRNEARNVAKIAKDSNGVSSTKVTVGGKSLSLLKTVELVADIYSLVVSISDTFEKSGNGKFLGDRSGMDLAYDGIYLAGLGVKTLQLGANALELLVATTACKVAAKSLGGLYALQQTVQFAVAAYKAYDPSKNVVQSLDFWGNTLSSMGSLLLVVDAGYVVGAVAVTWATSGFAAAMATGAAFVASPVLPFVAGALLIAGAVLLLIGEWDKVSSTFDMIQKANEAPSPANAAVLTFLEHVEDTYEQVCGQVPTELHKALREFRDYLTPAKGQLLRDAQDLPPLRDLTLGIDSMVYEDALARKDYAAIKDYPFAKLCRRGIPMSLAAMLADGKWPTGTHLSPPENTEAGVCEPPIGAAPDWWKEPTTCVSEPAANHS